MSTVKNEKEGLPKSNDFMEGGDTQEKFDSLLSQNELSEEEEEENEEEEKPKRIPKSRRPPLNPDGSKWEGSVARVQNEDGVIKKRIPIQLQGLSSKMLPPITKRKVARYEVLGKDKIDPLTGQIVSPVPPLIIPGKFVVFDPFDKDVLAQHKLLKNVTRSERVVRDGKDMVEEVVEDIIFDNGLKGVAIERNYLEYVLLELHPLNESNRWRDKSQAAAFRRIDIDSKRWSETASGLDFAYEAETAVVNMRTPEEIIAYAHSAGIHTVGRILDGGDGTVKFDLRKFARQNPKEFFKLNPTTEQAVKISVLDAKELGLIYYQLDKKSWFFSTDDEIICNHLAGEDPEKMLIKYLSNKKEDECKEKYSILQNQLNYWD